MSLYRYHINDSTRRQSRIKPAQLKNARLDDYARETLQQHLHHLTVTEQERSAKRPKKIPYKKQNK